MSETIKEETAPALKPCPFCGEAAAVRIDDSVDSRPWFHVSCRGCLVMTDGDRLQVDAITTWNRRADPWILVREQPPTINTPVLVVMQNGPQTTAAWSGGAWHTSPHAISIPEPVWWRPLPDAPSSFNSPDPQS